MKGTLLVLCLLCITGTASAQPCEYEPSDAVQDTLDPKGYLPLRVGNAWEYDYFGFLTPSDPFREEVVEEVPWQGRSLFKIRRTVYRSEGTPPNETLVDVDTGHAYWAVFGDTLYWGASPDVMEAEDTQFRHPFESCYSVTPSNMNEVTVRGGYGGVAAFREGTRIRSIEVDALKSFLFFSVEGKDYAYGIGLVYAEAEGGFGYSLKYARIDGAEYGMRIEQRFPSRIAADDELPTSAGLQLQVSPVPTSGTLHARVLLPQASEVRVTLYDVTGRAVRVLMDGERLLAGASDFTQDLSGLSSGGYFLVVQAEGYPLVSRAVVLLK